MNRIVSNWIAYPLLAVYGLLVFTSTILFLGNHGYPSGLYNWLATVKFF